MLWHTWITALVFFYADVVTAAFTVSITPQDGLSGTQVTLSFAGVVVPPDDEPFVNYYIFDQDTDKDIVNDYEPAESDGTGSVTFNLPPEIQPGYYGVSAEYTNEAGNTIYALNSYFIVDEREITVTGYPTNITPNTSFPFTVSGMAAQSHVIYQLQTSDAAATVVAGPERVLVPDGPETYQGMTMFPPGIAAGTYNLNVTSPFIESVLRPIIVGAGAPQLQVSPTTVGITETITISASGGTAGESFQYDITQPDGGRIGGDTVPVDSKGSIQVTFTIPAGAVISGGYTVTVTNTDNSQNAQVNFEVIVPQPLIILASSGPFHQLDNVAFSVNRLVPSSFIQYRLTHGGTVINSATGSGTANDDGQLPGLSVTIPAGAVSGVYGLIASELITPDGGTPTEINSNFATFDVVLVPPTVVVSPATVTPGTPFTVTISGAASDDVITYSIERPDYTIIFSGSTASNDDGVLTQEFTIPFGYPPSTTYHVRAQTSSLLSVVDFPLQIAQLNLALQSPATIVGGQKIKFAVTQGIANASLAILLYNPPAPEIPIVIVNASIDDTGSIPTQEITMPMGEAGGVYDLRAEQLAYNSYSNVVEITVGISVTVTPSIRPGRDITISIKGALSFTPISIVVTRPDSSTMVNETVSGTVYGSVNYVYTIPPGSINGQYGVSVTSGSQPPATATFDVLLLQPAVTMVSSSNVIAGGSITFNVTNGVSNKRIEFVLYNSDDEEATKNTAMSTDDNGNVVNGILSIPGTTSAGSYNLRVYQPDFGFESLNTPIEVLANPSIGPVRARRLRRRKIKADCPIPGETACYSKHGNFECVDFSTNLMHCGGCNEKGTNCLEIESAVGVSCRAGQCYVSSCEGFMRPNKDHSGCRA